MHLFPNLQVPMLPNYGPNRPGSVLSYNGATFSINGVPCNGHYIFVAMTSTNPFGSDFRDHNGVDVNIYLGVDCHHDDLALGQPVNYAGTLDFVNGRLSRWSNQSGHYQPHAIYRDQAPTVFDGALFEVVTNDGTLASFNPLSPNYI